MSINWINLYVLPIICLIGLVIEVASSITFYKINSTPARRRKPIGIYQYLLLYSISEMAILVINILFGVFNCGSYCGIETLVSTKFIKQFERFAKIFGCNTLYTFNILIELKIACDRYEKVIDLKRLCGSKRYKTKSTSRLNHSPSLIGLLLLMLSVFINTPYIYIFKIDEETSALKPDLDVITNRPVWLKSVAVVYFLKDFFCLVFVCVFNFLLFMALRSRELNPAKHLTTVAEQQQGDEPVQKNDQLDMSQKFKRFYQRKEKNVSKMIMLLSALFLIGHLPETFYRIKRKLSILFFTNFNYLSYYLVVSNIISFVASYFNLLIYLYFSQTFRHHFKKCFLRCSRSQSNENSSQ